MTFSQAKECIDDLGRRGLENLLEEYDEETIEAALDCGVPPSEIEEAYQGKYDSDAQFVRSVVEDGGDLPKLPPYVHIDWERTSHDVMMDYSESNGRYFRNL